MRERSLFYFDFSILPLRNISFSNSTLAYCPPNAELLALPLHRYVPPYFDPIHRTKLISIYAVVAVLPSTLSVLIITSSPIIFSVKSPRRACCIMYHCSPSFFKLPIPLTVHMVLPCPVSLAAAAHLITENRSPDHFCIKAVSLILRSSPHTASLRSFTPSPFFRCYRFKTPTEIYPLLSGF